MGRCVSKTESVVGLPAWTPKLRARGWIAMETLAGVPLAPPPAHGRWFCSQSFFLPQAGQQPVPGPRDGTAGQRAEWEGLSHSEDQVMQTQKPLSGMPTCCTGTGAPFPSSSLLKRPGMLSGRGAFEACGSGCTVLISAHSRKFQRLKCLICEKREGYSEG